MLLSAHFPVATVAFYLLETVFGVVLVILVVLVVLIVVVVVLVVALQQL